MKLKKKSECLKFRKETISILIKIDSAKHITPQALNLIWTFTNNFGMHHSGIDVDLAIMH